MSPNYVLTDDVSALLPAHVLYLMSAFSAGWVFGIMFILFCAPYSFVFISEIFLLSFIKGLHYSFYVVSYKKKKESIR